MIPSVRKAIRRLFPEAEESTVLGILTRIGTGISHPASAILYDHLLASSDGNLERLAELVDWAIAKPDQFQEYIARFVMWRHAVERYESSTIPELRSIAPIIKQAAPIAAEFRCSFIISHDTFGFYDRRERFPCPIAFSAIPTRDAGLILTEDEVDSPYLPESSFADEISGEWASAENGVAKILDNISKHFVHDCYPESPDEERT